MFIPQQATILVVRMRFHGDILLTTPLLQAIKQGYPDAQLDYLLYSDTQSLLSEHSLIRDIYSLTRKPKNILLQFLEFWSLWKTVRRNRYDLILNLSEQWPIALLCRLSGTRSIAFAKERGQTLCWRLCFTQLVTPDRQHAVARNLSILQPLDINIQQPKLSLYYQAEQWQRVQQYVPSGLLNDPYVVIQPTSRQRFKDWGEAACAQVIDHLMQRGFTVFLTSGPAEDEIARTQQIANQCQQSPQIALAGKLHLLELAALIDHACLFIGVDSAPMHMAAALNTPIVCLFGATNKHYWRPWSSHYKLLWAGNYQPMPARKDLDRQFNYLCVIPVQDVIQSVDSMLPADIASALEET